MRAIDAKQFQQLFDQFDHPVLLKTGQGWLTNPAAQSLCLSQADLDQLKYCENDASLWLARQFYRVSASRTDGELLLMLQPDTFLASAAENIAAQLRDRLSTAFGSTAALSESQALRSDLRARENLSAVNQELYRILNMVMQLERCSPANALVSRMCRVDMAHWFRKLAGELEEQCQKAGVKFTAESDVQILPMVANGRQLEYMVLSLVSNSLKNAPEKDGRVSLSMKRQQDQLVITVTDNAGGFSPDYLTHPLWNEPQRLLPRRGLGLGLPLAQRIAADHGGVLMVFPSQQGVRVAISLPIRDGAEFLGQPDPLIDDTPGFSLAKIVLSDALPRSAYFPNPYGDDE